MEDSPRRRLERKSGSSSRSPSLSRRPSLKDKKAPGTIAKVKGKKSGGSGSKKERWLLTRKTWRYMSDAVGNLLPETHRSTAAAGSSSGVGTSATSFTAGPSGSGGSTRRTSASGAVSCEPGHSSSFHPVASTPGFHVADIPGGGGGGGGNAPTGGASRPRSMPSAIPTAGTSSGQQSKASSTVTSPTYGGIMSFPSHRPGVTPTGPGPGKVVSPTSHSQQQQILISTDKFYPPSDDIPTLEKHFEAVCNKEKRFLLWTRTKPKGISGPALRDLKSKQKDSKGCKGTKPGSSGHRDSSGSIFEALHLRFGGGAKENVGGEYYSPTTEEDDDYDEYDDQDEITVRERRKSSTASSTSMLGTGQCWTQGSLTFFRPLSTLSSHGSESSYSMILTPQGITKICRNTGTQTDPFPEELLIRFRLQAVQEERQQQQQQQCLRQISPDAQSDATTVESPMSPVRLDTAQKVPSPPPTTTTASPMSPTTSTDGVRSSGSGRESQEKLLETTAASSTRPSISGQSESMATTKGGEGASTSTTTTTTTSTTDKKSEESGYSSSISDTVMRYLRMVRKNSKADNKDTIDKFKTVNYDRSLRYIKSKNVTVEEALEHERNKEAMKNQVQQEVTQPQPQQAITSNIAASLATTTSEVISSPSKELGEIIPESPNSKKSGDPTKVAKTTGVEGEQQQAQFSPTGCVPSSDAVEGVAGEQSDAAAGNTRDNAVLPGSPSKTSRQQSEFDNDIPPSSPPPPPPLSPSMMSPQDGRAFSPGSPPPPSQQEGPSSVGIQAGESLIRFLKNLNPNPLARKMSDFSSSCCSSESPVDLFSPRYSFGTTVMSGSDTEMFSGAGGVHQAAMASMMAMAAAKGGRRPLDSQSSAGVPQTPGGPMDFDASSEFDDVFQGMQASFFQKQHHPQHSGPLSSSWTSSGASATTSTSQTTIKKSSSVQQMMSFGGATGGAEGGHPTSNVPITTTSSSSSYSLSQLFHYSPSKSFRSRDRDKAGGSGGGGGVSPDTTSTPATPTTSSIGGSSGGLMKTFFGSSPFSSTFGLKKSGLRKPTSTTSLTITTNTGSDSVSGRGHMNAPPPTTSSSPNLLSLIQSSAASAGTGFTNLFSSSSRSGSSITSASASRGGVAVAASSSAASSSGELRAQEAGSSSSLVGSPYLPLYARSSLPISVTGGDGAKSTRRGLGTHHHHPHHHHHHTHVSTGSSSFFMPTSGLSDYLYSHDSSSSAGKAGSASSTRSNVDLLYLTPSGVMQKSKSSSSVLPLYGSSGSVSGGTRGASSTSTLRVSPSGSIGGDGGGGAGGGGEAAAAGTAPATSSATSAGGRLISKSKLFKSRSKSSTRATTSSSGSAVCTWSPQGRCKWKSVSGRVVTLEPTTVLSLSEVERLTLQDVALEKLRALNLGVDVKIPKEKVGGGQQKPKRRPYLLKKKALSTGFFESGSKREDTKESTGGGSGLVFGISLSQCVTNDRLRQTKASATAAAQLSADWEQQTPQQQGSATNKRSQNGSRNSVSSVFEMPRDDKDPLQAIQPTSTSASVPAIVTACINHLENYGLHTTGIFRVSTSLKRIRQLREDLDSGKDIQFGEDHSPHDVAALLKEFLRDLPEPLLCRDLYQAFLKTQKIRNRKLQLEAIQHLVQLLPVSNRDTLAALLKFFAKVVANSSETRSKTGELLPGNKMEGYSLATLIAPNILPCMPTEGAAVAAAAAASASSMDQNAALTKERRESIDLVNYMISNYGAIFDVTPELLHDVYLHLMDTNPEAIEGILRQRCGIPDDGIDELETTSSVFEESEGGEVVDPEEALASSSRVYRRREEILHEGAGKGGVGTDDRTRERRLRRDESGAIHSSGGAAGAGASSDTEKQTQSGGESDSSIGTRSTSRWFRRSRGDAKGRTSSDSGSEKVKGSRKRESSLFESKRASSLDSVNIQEPLSSSGGAPSTQSIRVSPRTSAVISGVSGTLGGPGDIVTSRPLSGSDQSLRVPEHLMSTRRQSSPVLESSGIITASLKIPVPVPLNIDDTDIPYIEDENNVEAGGGTTSVHPYHHHHHHLVHHHQQQHYQPHSQYQPPPPQQQQQPPSQQQKHPPAQYPYPYHQMHTQQPYDVSSSATDPSNVTMVRCRSMSTDSSVPLKTTSSSVTTTPISSPARQPSSEISSPTGFSPPTSPPLYGTFPIEEMTARMLIGSAAGSSSTPSTVTALSSSPSMHQFHHHGAITMTTPSGVVATSSTVHQYPSITTTAATKDPSLETKSAGSTPVTRPKIDKTASGGLTSAASAAASPSSSSSTSSATTSTGRPATVVSSSPHLTQKSLSNVGQGAIASLAISTTTKSATSPQQPTISSTASPSSVATHASSSQQPSSSSSTSHTVPPVSTQPTPASGPSSSQTTSSGFMLLTGEPKGLGRETKGANIGGLIKSKTADFEKLTTTKPASSVEPTPSEVTPSGSGGNTGSGSSGSSSGGSTAGTMPGMVSTPEPAASGLMGSKSSGSIHHHQIYSIAPKMRLRSQENVLLKQQFLLRQQQQHQQGESSTSRRERAASLKGAEQTTQLTSAAEQLQQQEEVSSHQQQVSSGGGGSSGRSITRRRLVGSASSSAIISSSGKPSSSSTGGGSSTTGPPQQRVRSRESESGSSGSSTNTGLLQVQPAGQSSSPSTSTSVHPTSASSGSSPSRWKRSEIIASRQQSQSSTDPETFV